MKHNFHFDEITVSPSRAVLRVYICVLAAIGATLALYLGLYQWGFIDKIQDPLFGIQSEKVLNSDLSHLMRKWFRIPEGILGAIAYLGVLAFSSAGSSRRWQERPWLVFLMSANLLFLEIASLLFLYLQGAVIGSWCFFCLTSALISFVLMALAYQEIAASLRFLFSIWKENRDLRLLLNTCLGKASFIAYKAAEELMQKRRRS